MAGFLGDPIRWADLDPFSSPLQKSMGAACPKLRNEAYAGVRLEEQLEQNTKHFFAQDRHFRVDRPGRTVRLSSIMRWFGEDFGGSDRAKLDFAARYVDEGDRDLLRSEGLRVRYLPYDWSLNERKPAPANEGDGYVTAAGVQDPPPTQAGCGRGRLLPVRNRFPIYGMDLIPVPLDDADQDPAGDLPRLRVGDSKEGGNAS